MSPRARVVSPDTVLEAFDWSGAAAAAAPGASVAAAGASVGASVRRPLAERAPVADPAIETEPGVPGLAEPTTPTDTVGGGDHHQARLAALEREAFTKGYAQGERAGMEAGGKRAEAMLRRVAHTIEELGGLRQTLMQETERQMVQLALTLARRVVHREVTLDPELAAALAHVALERLGTTTPATIRLNPEDYTVVTQDGARWGTATVTVVPDPAISRGGCLVESEFGSVDATIERQFDELSRALFGES